MKKQKIFSCNCCNSHYRVLPFYTIPKRGRTVCDNSGFTLIELLVVVAILGVLVALAISPYIYFVNSTKSSRSIADIRTLDKEITGYLIDKGVLPDDLSKLNRANLRDPWGNQYVFINHSIVGSVPYKDFTLNNLNEDYDLYSRGANGKSTEDLNDDDSLDDIVRSAEGADVCLGWLY